MAEVGRNVLVEKIVNGVKLTQEVHESKWNERSQPWQNAGWTKVEKKAAEPKEAKKADKPAN